jgi:hypothetical protein
MKVKTPKHTTKIHITSFLFTSDTITPILEWKFPGIEVFSVRKIKKGLWQTCNWIVESDKPISDFSY